MVRFIHIFTDTDPKGVYLEYDDIQALEEWARAHTTESHIHIRGEEGVVAFAATILRNKGKWKNVTIH